MGDSRNRPYSMGSRLGPKFISTGSAGSRRVQRLHGISTHYAGAQPEVLENADGFETGPAFTVTQTNHANDYARVQNHSFLPVHGCSMSRLSLSGNVPTHGGEYQSSSPIWGMADSGLSLPVEGRAMGESAVKANVQGQPIFPLSRDLMTSSNTVSGGGSFGEVTRDNIFSHGQGSLASGSVSVTGFMDPVFEHKSESGTHFMLNAPMADQNFSQVPPYYSSAPAAGTFVHPLDTLKRQNSYGLNDNIFWCEASTEPNHGATSSVRGPFKRKISALGSPVIGSQSVSSHMSNIPARYNPMMSRSDNNGRRRVGNSSPNSTFTFSGSPTGQTFVPANELPEGSRAHSSEEPQFSQGRGFPRKLPIRHSEPLRSNWPFGTSISGEIVMQCNQDNGISGSLGIEIERTSTNFCPAYTQAMQIENPAPQAHVWSSSRIQEGATSANTNPTGERFADFSSSVDQLSGLHGGHNSSIPSHGRENSLLRVTAGALGSSILEHGFDHNHSTTRVGQMIASNQGPYEGFRADGSIGNLTMNSGGSVSRNWINSHPQPMSSVNALPKSAESDHQIRRVPSCQPWAHSRHFNHPTTWSTTLMPSAPPSSSVISPNFRRHPSSAHLFGAPQMESSVEHLNGGFPSATARMPAGLPLHRVYRVRTNDDRRRHDMSDGVAEQLLMLEATVLFGDIGLQDQHSDWRLDVDNMSYEELLALEERIGNVCTGLTEDGISEKLKTIKYSSQDASATSPLQETVVKCSICQEEYEEGDNLGYLDCGHSYHAICIKQWLVKKNQCPVCKASAFS
ncbi:hypothetical protein O6H91_04G033700 [Diphasiastrum complanatum]|uniref:Uncharacterized protein n=5 Tax=Diphasiastrum complanatum TaxID=34168 RepID=A0ACC2DVQ5_DIPCM|nr:hypothetical protein O6H91_04G033700 [Diphasiastrum complanatum]KAJ7558327.1 hypothetical protein O6H91_04G033700 [Diphasiastrum complanatum]KAJ7558328.1 hypothetical protein O6H91_04G033700 [Diphasiastrum complanatum]KAJ7558329.1 hypothetical protein O6H91_04G033700 [Diphasiastrum complanatum]KAJ7558330.1 hypothetical protein O6H91_04G033700 [Diphasiastrum complanatum]